jgi:hypothetical protein
MATAYGGNTLVPPMLGVVLKAVSFSVFPFLIFGFALILWWSTERLNQFQQPAING